MRIHFLQEKFFNSSLNTKLKFIYTALVLFCLVSNILILRIFFAKEVAKTVSGLTSQTVETVSKNISNSLNTVSETSTYLLGTSDVQGYLESTQHSDYAIVSRKLRNSLYLSLEAMPMVSSIMIIKPSGVYEGAARYALPDIQISVLQECSWYEELLAGKGAPIYTTNEEETFSFPDGKSYVSLIRLVNSTEDAHFLGYMAIHISVDSLFSFAREESERYSDFYVTSASGTHPLLPFLSEELNEWIAHVPVSSIDSGSVISTGYNRFFLFKFEDDCFGWNYVAAMNYRDFTSQHRPFFMISILTLAAILVFFLIIAVCTNHFITNPLQRLMQTMNAVEEGHFVHAAASSYRDEIGQLQNVYNHMVDKIEELLTAKVEEQKILRKTELAVLQEQIKPHFLYNSLGAISYLVTAGQNEQAYELLLALSDYYRESLSKGSEIIPLRTEVNIVRNYLKLQKIRFPDAFEASYDLQENALSYEVPRLILQPLAENALYHGLLPSGEFGTIDVRICICSDILTICVSDDGIGIPQETLAEVLENNRHQSFGLHATIERMQIFYETPDICTVKSMPGKGTTVTFHIPIGKLEEYYGTAKTESHDR